MSMRWQFFTKFGSSHISSHLKCNQQQQRTFLHQATRKSAIRSFFQLLESNYGNLSSLIDTGPPSETIVSSDGILYTDHLIRLFQHEATVLHVHNFYHSGSANRLGEELIQESISRAKSGNSSNWKISTSRGLESSDVGTTGEHSPYNVAVAHDIQQSKDDELPEMKSSFIDDYFDGVQRELRMRRRKNKYTSRKMVDVDDSDYHQLWPLDKLRLELEESWPSGCGLARETVVTKGYPRPFGGGLPRIMVGPTRWKRGFIHVDELGSMDTEKGLFTANIYLKMPENKSTHQTQDKTSKTGADDAGSLHVWPLRVRSKWDWYRNAITLSGLSTQDPESQLLLQKNLGKANIIRPVSGDLVIFCAQRPHCAVGFDKGTRISLQCFLQYQGLNNRILIDC